MKTQAKMYSILVIITVKNNVDLTVAATLAAAHHANHTNDTWTHSKTICVYALCYYRMCFSVFVFCVYVLLLLSLLMSNLLGKWPLGLKLSDILERNRGQIAKWSKENEALFHSHWDCSTNNMHMRTKWVLKGKGNWSRDNGKHQFQINLNIAISVSVLAFFNKFVYLAFEWNISKIRLKFKFIKFIKEKNSRDQSHFILDCGNQRYTKHNKLVSKGCATHLIDNSS